MIQLEVCIPVEVEGKYGEFYPGVINGLKSLEELNVTLLDSSHSKALVEFTLPPSSLRLPPKDPGTVLEPVQGLEVDVLISSSPGEPSVDHEQPSDAIASKLSAWWPAVVRKIGGSFVIVELMADFSSENAGPNEVIVLPNKRISVPHPSSLEKTDIVEKHQLRPRVHHPNLSVSSFHIHAIDIPDELAPYCKEPANYHHFARRCGLPVLITLAPDTFKPVSPVIKGDSETYNLKSRLLVISTDVSTINRASVIDNTFVDMLRQKVSILQQTEELSKKLVASRLNQQSPFVEEFLIPLDLIHYAIGAQGSNIRRASAIEGVLSVKLDRQTGNIRISGKTQDAVKNAKKLLDFSQDIFQIPKSYVGPILGSGRRHVQHIVDRVGLVGIKISKSPEDDREHVSFQLTGTQQAIRDTQLFLEFQVASLQELDRLRGVENPPSILKPKNATIPLEDISSNDESSNHLTHSENGHRISNGDNQSSKCSESNYAVHSNSCSNKEEPKKQETTYNNIANSRPHPGGRQPKPRSQVNHTRPDPRQIPPIQRGGGESVRNSGSNHTGVSKSSANHVNSKNPNQQRNQPNHRSDSMGPRGQNMCAPIVS
ncbi:fragile X related 1, frx1 [Schistosoma mansoni]|uniref:Fragile X related 1, frx1 n=1 Tax=Schistosoma mansoni TaxID=6183 RepID=G4VBN1_SCHMA|nr:fragile X related 1, frx1 [Schistosoma mansoni]|eukprot:XP_018649929.1 fragile X related 1, frx1 [Schistosoma mansoni]